MIEPDGRTGREAEGEDSEEEEEEDEEGEEEGPRTKRRFLGRQAGSGKKVSPQEGYDRVLLSR